MMSNFQFIIHNETYWKYLKRSFFWYKSYWNYFSRRNNNSLKKLSYLITIKIRTAFFNKIDYNILYSYIYYQWLVPFYDEMMFFLGDVKTIYSNKNIFFFKLLANKFLFDKIFNRENVYNNNIQHLILRNKSLFFLVTPSPWPIFSSIAAFVFLFGFSGYLNFYCSATWTLLVGLIMVILSFNFWLSDLITELVILKRYSVLIKNNLRMSFWLFIVSEVMLFFGFFWAFFHFSVEPSIYLATIWPPFEGIQMNSIIIPLANTIFLLSSGAALTWLQYSLLAGNTVQVLVSSLFLFFYGILFLFYQVHEYIEAFHQVNDGVFGSSLYILTLFHGLHVLVGLIMLMVSLFRFFSGHFFSTTALGFVLSGWYWHFVDVVWIMVFIWLYLWGTWLADNSISNFCLNISSYYDYTSNSNTNYSNINEKQVLENFLLNIFNFKN